MHSCDNIKCLNPEHLSLGTYADNNKDRSNKGRSYQTITKRLVTLVMSYPTNMTNKEVSKLVSLDFRRVGEIRSGKRGPDGRLIKQ